MPKIKAREDYIEQIICKIIDFRMKNNSRNPEYIFMTTALFKALGGKNKDKTKFAEIKIQVYEGESLEYYLVEKVYEVQNDV